jgi:hypothetical protein
MRIVGFLLFTLGATTAFAQPAGLAPSAGVAPAKIFLSGSTTLTLALEGPAPLRVAMPEEPAKLLTPESAAVWRIRPAGPPRADSLGDGRERWMQSFRLDPFAAGNPVVVAFAPVKVTAGTDLNAQEVTWPTVNVTVELERWKDAGRDDLEKARQDARITGIETLPPLPPPDPGDVGWKVAAVLGAVFALVVAAALVRRWRAKPPPLPPGEWAERELTRLETDLAEGRATTAAAADRTAMILRGYIERRFALSATKLTTAELLASAEQAGWPADAAGELREILERCDRAKFAGDAPDDDEAAGLILQSRDWVKKAAAERP